MLRFGAVLAGLGIVGAGIAGGLGGAAALRAGEPPDTADIPGDVAGVLDCRWIAPWVATYGTDVAEKGGARTIWFDASGAVVRDVLAAGALPFVPVPAKDGSQAVHGTLADWTIELPPPPPAPAKWDITILGSSDGRTFVRQQTGEDGMTTADVWIDGTWRGRAGPYVRWRGRSLHVGGDGSLAIEAGRAPGERGMRVLLFAPGAKASGEVPCAAEDWVAAVAPAGRGVVLRRPREGGPDELQFGSAAGLRPLDLPGNADFAAWVPGTARAVVECGTEEAPRLRLVDLETGAVAWDVEDQPLRGRRSWPGVAVEGDLVLLSGLEASPVGKVTHWRRRADALDLATGKTVATWRSSFVGAVGYAAAPSLLRRGAALHFVAPDQFAPVNVAHIRAKSHGWN